MYQLMWTLGIMLLRIRWWTILTFYRETLSLTLGFCLLKIFCKRVVKVNLVMMWSVKTFSMTWSICFLMMIIRCTMMRLQTLYYLSLWCVTPLTFFLCRHSIWVWTEKFKTNRFSVVAPTLRKSRMRLLKDGDLFFEPRVKEKASLGAGASNVIQLVLVHYASVDRVPILLGVGKLKKNPLKSNWKGWLRVSRSKLLRRQVRKKK